MAKRMSAFDRHKQGMLQECRTPNQKHAVIEYFAQISPGSAKLGTLTEEKGGRDNHAIAMLTALRNAAGTYGPLEMFAAAEVVEVHRNRSHARATSDVSGRGIKRCWTLSYPETGSLVLIGPDTMDRLVYGLQYFGQTFGQPDIADQFEDKVRRSQENLEEKDRKRSARAEASKADDKTIDDLARELAQELDHRKQQSLMDQVRDYAAHHRAIIAAGPIDISYAMLELTSGQNMFNWLRDQEQLPNRVAQAIHRIDFEPDKATDADYLACMYHTAIHRSIPLEMAIGHRLRDLQYLEQHGVISIDEERGIVRGIDGEATHPIGAINLDPIRAYIGIEEPLAGITAANALMIVDRFPGLLEWRQAYNRAIVGKYANSGSDFNQDLKTVQTVFLRDQHREFRSVAFGERLADFEFSESDRQWYSDKDLSWGFRLGEVTDATFGGYMTNFYLIEPIHTAEKTVDRITLDARKIRFEDAKGQRVLVDRGYRLLEELPNYLDVNHGTSGEEIIDTIDNALLVGSPGFMRFKVGKFVEVREQAEAGLFHTTNSYKEAEQAKRPKKAPSLKKYYEQALTGDTLRELSGLDGFDEQYGHIASLVDNPWIYELGKLEKYRSQLVDANRFDRKAVSAIQEVDSQARAFADNLKEKGVDIYDAASEDYQQAAKLKNLTENGTQFVSPGLGVPQITTLSLEKIAEGKGVRVLNHKKVREQHNRYVGEDSEYARLDKLLEETELQSELAIAMHKVEDVKQYGVKIHPTTVEIYQQLQHNQHPEQVYVHSGVVNNIRNLPAELDTKISQKLGAQMMQDQCAHLVMEESLPKYHTLVEKGRYGRAVLVDLESGSTDVIARRNTPLYDCIIAAGFRWSSSRGKQWSANAHGTQILQVVEALDNYNQEHDSHYGIKIE